MYTYPILRTNARCEVKRAAELPDLGELRALIHPVEDEPRGLEVIPSDDNGGMFIVSVPSNGAEHLPVNPFVFKRVRGNILLSRVKDYNFIGVTEEDLAALLQVHAHCFWE